MGAALTAAATTTITTAATHHHHLLRHLHHHHRPSVAKPWLQFQFAKLDFEKELTSQTDLTYSIVRYA